MALVLNLLWLIVWFFLIMDVVDALTGRRGVFKRRMGVLAMYVTFVAGLVAIAILGGLAGGLGFFSFFAGSAVFAWAFLRAGRESPSPSDEQLPAGFFREVSEMLGQLDPPALDHDRSRITPRSDEILLAHSDRPEWDVMAEFDEWSIVVGVAGAHEHFEHFEAAPGERPWTSAAVDFIAEVLCGEVEVQKTYRGSFVVRVEHGRRDSDGAFQPFGTMVPLTPAHLLRFAARRVEVQRPDFGARHQRA